MWGNINVFNCLRYRLAYVLGGHHHGHSHGHDDHQHDDEEQHQHVEANGGDNNNVPHKV